MKPIVLTKYGETLLEYPTKKETLDSEKLSSCIGLHQVCNGWLDITKVSKTYNAILCRHCGLRLVIPKKINTYGKLRKFLAKTN